MKYMNIKEDSVISCSKQLQTVMIIDSAEMQNLSYVNFLTYLDDYLRGMKNHVADSAKSEYVCKPKTTIPAKQLNNVYMVLKHLRTVKTGFYVFGVCLYPINDTPNLCLNIRHIFKNGNKMDITDIMTSYLTSNILMQDIIGYRIKKPPRLHIELEI